MGVAVLFLLIAVVGATLSEEWRTAIKEKVQLRFAELRAAQFDASSPAWTHSRDLFAAVHGGNSEFVVAESVTKEDSAKWDFSDFHSLQSKAIYDTKSTYKMLPATTFHSLDLPKHDSLMQELGSEHVKHCMADSAIKADDIIIGSNNGAWFKTNVVTAAPANSLFLERDDHSMVLARRVLSVENLEGGCKRINTEHLHYLELFDSVRHESSGHWPFHEVPATKENLDLAASTTERVRAATNADGTRRGLAVVNPDKPLVACSAFRTPVGSQYYGPGGDAASGILYNIGSAAGCVQYNYDVGSISMNYNWNTHSALNYDQNIGPGLSCKNCYVFSGAGFMAIAQYSTRKYFYMEVKIGGGAGAMVTLRANNPSISGSLGPFVVQSTGKPISFPIGGGLSIGLSSTGLQVTVSGSGGVNGGGTFSGGAEAYASLGLMYAQGKSSWPVTKFANKRPLQSTLKFTSARALSATVMVTGGIGVSLSLGGFVGSVNGHIDVTVTGNIQWNTGAFLLRAAVDSQVENEKTSSRSLKGSTALTQSTYHPGSTIPVTIEYDGYNSNEEHVAYYSIVTPSGEEHKVMHKAFTTSPSGKGSFTAHWLVPTNDDLTGVSHVRVRTSNRYTRPVDTAPFALRPREEGFLHISSALQSLLPRADAPFTVTWDPAALNHYRMPPMSPIKGVDHSCNRVRFELIRHRLDDEGNLIDSSSWRDLSNDEGEQGGAFYNTGVSSIRIPQQAITGWDSYQLRVHADNNDRVAGSTGFFTVENQNQNQNQNQIKKKKNANQTPSRDVASTALAAVVASATATATATAAAEEQRQLAACKGILICASASIMGAIDNFKILLWTVPLGLATQAVPLLPQYCACA